MAMCTLSNDYRAYLQHNDQDMKYGLPGKKKYPMPDRDHVMSAIKFFNYVSPSDEEELARNILNRIREYGIEDINVGEDNRFGKYYKADDHLEHHGVKGQKWGVRNYQDYDGHVTPLGREHYGYGKARGNASVNKEFVKSKLQYVDKELSKYKKQQETPKYQKKNAEAQKLQSELDKLKPQTDKIRDKKLFKDKNPNVLEQLKLNKEVKLQAKLDKRNKYLNAINEKVDNLTSRQEHYKSLLNDFALGKIKGDSKAKGIFEPNDDSRDTLKKIVSGETKNTNLFFRDVLLYDIKNATRSILKPYATESKAVDKLSNSFIIKEAANVLREDYLNYKDVSNSFRLKQELGVDNKSDLENFRKARKTYENTLQKAADNLLGDDYKDREIKLSHPYAYEGQDVITNTKMSKLVKTAMWRVNATNKLSGADFDGDKVIRVAKLSNKLTDATLSGASNKEIYKILSGAGFDDDKVVVYPHKNTSSHKLSGADFDGDKVVVFKNDAATREAMRLAKSDGWDSLTKKQKELLEEAYEG